MATTGRRVKDGLARSYDQRGVLGGLVDRPVEFSLDEELRRQILQGARGRRLQNISIKLDPV